MCIGDPFRFSGPRVLGEVGSFLTPLLESFSSYSLYFFFTKIKIILNFETRIDKKIHRQGKARAKLVQFFGYPRLEI